MWLRDKYRKYLPHGNISVSSWEGPSHALGTTNVTDRWFDLLLKICCLTSPPSTPAAAPTLNSASSSLCQSLSYVSARCGTPTPETVWMPRPSSTSSSPTCHPRSCCSTREHEHTWRASFHIQVRPGPCVLTAHRVLFYLPFTAKKQWGENPQVYRDSSNIPCENRHDGWLIVTAHCLPSHVNWFKRVSLLS